MEVGVRVLRRLRLHVRSGVRGEVVQDDIDFLPRMWLDGLLRNARTVAPFRFGLAANGSGHRHSPVLPTAMTCSAVKGWAFVGFADGDGFGDGFVPVPPPGGAAGESGQVDPVEGTLLATFLSGRGGRVDHGGWTGRCMAYTLNE